MAAPAGRPGRAVPRLSSEYAAGLRGDWRAAAYAWAAVGAPYERALELVELGEPEPMLEAWPCWTGWAPPRWPRSLGAGCARQLVLQVPRGPKTATRTDPAGPAGRRREILALVADGLTNAETAARLGLSARDGRPPRLRRADEARHDHLPRGGRHRSSPLS